MNTLKVERRNMQTKAKRIRREGFVTGNLFGREMEGSIPIQIPQKEADALIKTNGKGSQVLLELDGNQMDVLIKEIDVDTMKHQILEMDFQALVKGEKVHSVAEIVLLNHDKVTSGIVELDLHEISYRATPESLVEKIEINLENMRAGDEIKVKDLAIASDENVDLHTGLEETVVRIVEAHNTPMEEDTTEETVEE